MRKGRKNTRKKKEEKARVDPSRGKVNAPSHLTQARLDLQIGEGKMESTDLSKLRKDFGPIILSTEMRKKSL